MFDADVANGRPIKLRLKSGQVLTGTVQSVSRDRNEDDPVLFLTVENRKRLKAKLGIPAFKIFAELPLEQVAEFLERIPKNPIESYERVETEVSGARLLTNCGKEIQVNGFELKVTNPDDPGLAHVAYRMPGSDILFDAGLIAIKDGMVDGGVRVAFISYGREDEKQVAEISQRLRDNGVITWFDKRSLIPGDDWEMQIEKGIENADFYVLFASRATEEKIGVINREIQLALRQQSLRPRGRIYIIPVLLDDCNPPHDLRNLNWIKTTDQNWFEDLLQTVAPWYVKKDLRPPS